MSAETTTSRFACAVCLWPSFTYSTPMQRSPLKSSFVACESDDGTFQLATSYDRDLVVESALLIMARLRPLAQPAR